MDTTITVTKDWEDAGVAAGDFDIQNNSRTAMLFHAVNTTGVDPTEEGRVLRGLGEIPRKVGAGESLYLRSSTGDNHEATVSDA